MRKIVLFGAGKIAYAVSHYIKAWSSYEICGYATDAAYVGEGTFLGKPVVAFEEMAKRFPPAEFGAFVAVGYQGMNALRRQKVEEVENLGYQLVSVVHPAAPGDLTVGANCFVASAELIQPGVVCGNNVFVWNGALVGHHAELGDHCWITGGATIGGCVKIGRRCFVGIGATVGHELTVGADCMLGAGSLTTKSLDDGTVLIARDTEIYRLNSEQFLRFSDCFKA